MERFPRVPQASIVPEQQPLYDHIVNVYDKAFGPHPPYAFRDEEGAMLGPFQVIIHSPWIGTAMVDHIMNLSRDPTLSHPVKEIAILAVGAYYRCPFVLYAHSRTGLAVGLSHAQVTAVAAQRTPDDLTPAETAAYVFATATMENRGRVPDDIWHKTIAEVGKEGAVLLMYLVSAYTHLCVLQNVAQVGAPGEPTTDGSST